MNHVLTSETGDSRPQKAISVSIHKWVQSCSQDGHQQTKLVERFDTEHGMGHRFPKLHDFALQVQHKLFP
jgi:hypothetical protein